VPCTVRSVTTTSIVCETASVPALAPYPPPPPSPPPPNASLPAVAAAPVEEPAAVLYAGGRGVRRETWFARYAGGNFDSAIDGYAPNASHTTRLESFHGEPNVAVADRYTARYTGFFTPQTTVGRCRLNQVDP
jgi:hypothetical protein